ncbi:MAG: Hpt domain-containing protein [Pseudomonadota bacterium]
MANLSEAKAQFAGAGGCGHATTGPASGAVARPRASTPDHTPGRTLDYSGQKKPVDLVHLAKQSHGDRALEEEVLSLFLGQSDLYVERLSKASAADDRRMAAHALRGSALAIGAWEVARLSKAIELSSADPTNPVEMAGLSECVESTKSYIRSLLA